MDLGVGVGQNDRDGGRGQNDRAGGRGQNESGDRSLVKSPREPWPNE